jgi:hypothetical protein
MQPTCLPSSVCLSAASLSFRCLRQLPVSLDAILYFLSSACPMLAIQSSSSCWFVLSILLGFVYHMVTVGLPILLWLILSGFSPPLGCSIFAYIFFRFKAKRSEQRSVSHAFRLFASKFSLPFFRNISLFSHKIFFRFRFVFASLTFY